MTPVRPPVEGPEATSPEAVDAIRGHAVADNVPTAVATLTLDGTLASASPAFCRRFGLPEPDLLGQPLGRLVHPDDRANFEARNRALATGERQSWSGRIRYSVSGSGAGVAVAGDEVATVLRGADGRPAGVAIVLAPAVADPTLADTDARCRAIIDDITDTVCRFRGDGTIVFANEAYGRLYGKRAADLVGSRWQAFATPANVPTLERRLRLLSPARPGVAIELRLPDPGGGWRWVQFACTAFFDAAGNLAEVQSVGRDITARKEATERQQALLQENTRLSRELILVQEKERTALAREMHDEMSQQLAAIRAHAAALRRGGDRRPEKLHDDATAIENSARQIYAVSHRLMEGLHPQILDSAGLAEALDVLVKQWSERHTRTRLTFRRHGGLIRLGDEARIHLFRITQESLSNVARHADARQVRVFLGTIERHGQRLLRLVIRDNGVGVDTGAPRTGYGLILMRERARIIGGRLEFSSRPGRGTRIGVDLPFAQ